MDQIPLRYGNPVSELLVFRWSNTYLTQGVSSGSALSVVELANESSSSRLNVFSKNGLAKRICPNSICND